MLQPIDLRLSWQNIEPAGLIRKILNNKELRRAIFCAWNDRVRSLAEVKDLSRNITIVGLRFFSVKVVRHNEWHFFCGRLWKSGARRWPGARQQVNAMGKMKYVQWSSITQLY
jgi:hypothetical protein